MAAKRATKKKAATVKKTAPKPAAKKVEVQEEVGSFGD